MSRKTLIETKPPKEVKFEDLCNLVVTLDVFRACMFTLYSWDESHFYWRRLSKSEENLIIREVFSSDWQPHLSSSVIANLARWLKEHPDTQEDFTKPNPDLINFANGVLDVRTFQFRTGCREDKLTSCLNARYINEASDNGIHSEVFHNFCEKVFKKELLPEKENFLLQIMGYVIANRCDAKKAFFLIGPSNCGKSVILRFLMQVLGENNVSTLSMGNFADRFSKAELFGKIANLSGEIPIERVPATACDTFKQVVGSDTIMAERKFQDPFTFKPTSTLVFAGNIMPTFNSSDGSESIVERMALLVFDYSVEKAERDTAMEQKLLEDRDRIITAAVNKLPALIKSGFAFNTGEEERAMLAEYRKSNNSVNFFAETECEYAPDALSYISDLYDRYALVMSDAGIQPDKKSVFRKKMLTDLRVKAAGKHRLNGQPPKSCFSGIRLKAAEG